MKLVTYQIKGYLRRDGTEVILELSQDKTKKTHEVLSNVELKELPTIAARVGQENETQKNLAKETLFPNQQEAEVLVELKFLET